MYAKKGYLFCMDLRIYHQIIKLKVYQQDTLIDLINRLTHSIQQKQISKDKLKDKLQDQFKKIIIKTDLSETVKSKLDSLLDESKIIIVGIDTDKHQTSVNETPLRILQQSTITGKKAASQKLQKNIQQLKRDSSKFNLICDSQQIAKNYHQTYQQPNINYNYMISRTKNRSPSKLDYEINRNNEDSSTEIFQKRYEALDRKCQNYISKNIPNAELLDFRRHHPEHYKHNIREVEQYQRRDGYNQLVRQNKAKMKQQTINLQALSPKNINRYESRQVSETFQQYKVNRYKPPSISPHKLSKYQQPYQSRENRQNVMPFSSIGRIKYGSEKSGYKLYDNSCHKTIRNYDNLLNARLLNGNSVSCKRLRGRFNYLGQ